MNKTSSINQFVKTIKIVQIHSASFSMYICSKIYLRNMHTHNDTQFEQIISFSLFVLQLQLTFFHTYKKLLQNTIGKTRTSTKRYMLKVLKIK